jgi:diguanylate cyclase (GGDEF)-like protein/PAS domain S-box-containing protein
MTRQSDSTEEHERLLELYRMNILNQEPDVVLDAFCAKVAKLFNMPTCVVSLVLEDRQWFRSSFGCPVELTQARETPRNISFCTHVVETKQPLIVREISKDPRFSNNPLVKKYGFGFYAGFPLRTSRGHVLGSFCLYDTKARKFSKRELELLELFSERVIAHLELCRELERVQTSEAKFSGILDIAHEGIISVDDTQKIILFNKGAEKIFGYSQFEAVGQSIDILLPESDRAIHRKHIAEFGAIGRAARQMGETREIKGRRKNGEEFSAEASISKLEVENEKIFTVVLRDITERRQTEKALQESQRILFTLMGNLPGMVYRCKNDQDWNVEFASEGCYELTGYLPSDLTQKKVSYGRQIIHPDDQGPVWNDVQAALKENKPFQLIYRIKTATGEERWVWEQGRGIFSREGQLLALEGFITDITDRKRTEEILQNIAHGVTAVTGDLFFRSLVQHLAGALKVDYVFIAALKKDSQQMVETIALWARGAIVDNMTYDLKGTPSESFMEKSFCCYSSGVRQKFPNDYLLKEIGIESYLGVPLFDSSNHPLGLLVIMDRKPLMNIGLAESMLRIFAARAAAELERKHAEEILAEQAIRDVLTNLYNRRYFNHRIKEEVVRADRNKQEMALLMCDLEHFKAINDSRGHHVGDEVLRSVAQEIQQSTRGADLVFRWGGDEILVILSDTNREGVLIAADRIRKGVNKVGQQMNVELDISIGAVLYPEHGRTVDELVRLADRALYIAKKGGDKLHVGEEEYRLDKNTIKVEFQPVVDVGLNEVMGYEALSRDGQGRLSILELYKKYNAIGQLNELKCLCFRLQIKVAQEVGLKRVFINVDFNVLTEMDSLPKPSGMEIILEISELEALHDVENRLKIAERWRGRGYKFAIDDFGAGFISLPFVARLVPEYIKLDRSTMLQAVGSEKFFRFSKDLVQALRNYSTEGIIAEGIETDKELKVAKNLGIHLVQGFLLGRPQELKR